jgi:hypothetical protein
MILCGLGKKMFKLLKFSKRVSVQNITNKIGGTVIQAFSL